MSRDTIEKILRRKDLDRSEAASLMERIMSGALTDVQIAGVLVALRAKGATVDEIAGFASTMRSNSVQVRPRRNGLIDTCGTGGDGAGTFNISTAAALVAAGAGVGVAKHGNRAVSSRCGSSDVLEALGVAAVPAERVAGIIDDVGIGFMFAPAHHPATRHAVTARRELGVRTIFNLLGPLTNPALVRRQVMGVFDAPLTDTAAAVLRAMGSEKAYVVHGHDGCDEVSITDDTRVTVLDRDRLETFTFSPESVGVSRAAAGSVDGGSPQENARLIVSVLEGAKGPHRDAVVVNAGFAIAVAGAAQTIEEGVEAARAAIDSGGAMSTLDRLRAATARATGE